MPFGILQEILMEPNPNICLCLLCIYFENVKKNKSKKKTYNNGIGGGCPPCNIPNGKVLNHLFLKPQVGKNYAFRNFTGDIDGAQPQYQS
jgi:hypothetical protein